MTDCCKRANSSPLEVMASGLRTLPRQLRGFPEIRQALLAGIEGRKALSSWRPSGDDLGLMWLEMWAYIGDVLEFYDARIADESYVRTAVQRRALRRTVGLLGYSPRAGIAGSAKLAALARGSEPVTIPAKTAFRSRGFGNEPPQVFESSKEVWIDPAKNRWVIPRYKGRLVLDAAASVSLGGQAAVQGSSEGSSVGKGGKGQSSGSSGIVVSSLLFESDTFSLNKGELILLDDASDPSSQPATPASTFVANVEAIDGGDGGSYMKATFSPPVAIVDGFDLRSLRVRKPVQSIVATAHQPITAGAGKSKGSAADAPEAGEVFFDGSPDRFRKGERMIVSKEGAAVPELAEATIVQVSPAAVRMNLPTSDPPVLPATSVHLQPASAPNLSADESELSFHFDFVEAGRPTLIAKAYVTSSELSQGVPVGDPLQLVPREVMEGAQSSSATLGVLTQPFLLADAAGQAACVDGQLTVTNDRRATFRIADTSQLPADRLELPLLLYGNLVDVTRGQSVLGEVLGHGDARQAHQQFQLKKKPLTTVYNVALGKPESSLEVWVSGVRWRRVSSFYGCGPTDNVYVVTQDDEQRAMLTFGDGVRGARLPSGVKNVTANYRFGAGEAAPPRGAITQVAGAVKGLRAVASPLAPSPGKDPEEAEELRELAPRRALLLGRIVSTADFEAVASDAPGVIKATASWSWIHEQMQAGVRISYIGDAPQSEVVSALRAQADPTIPLAVTQATPIAVQLSITLESHPSQVPTAVAEAARAHLTDLGQGLLSSRHASIGGSFRPSRLFEALGQVEGVVGVVGVVFTASELALSISQPTCIPDGHYLDFIEAGSVTVSASASEHVVNPHANEGAP